MLNQREFIRQIPKAELHLHIEGTLEPELMFKIAKRNKLPIRFKNIEELKNAYSFHDLQSFLDIYYESAHVLLHEQDFYELTQAYLGRCLEEGIVHTEIFFDPQTHIHRGIPFKVIFNGIWRALQEAKKDWGISSELILCFLRHLSEEDAFRTLKLALPFQEHIIAIGLDSSEARTPSLQVQASLRGCDEGGISHSSPCR